jgi:hypothetical protein
MNPGVFAAVRDRLDVRDLAAAEGLSREVRHFDCPACLGRLKAMSRDGAGWYCVKCEARGDAVDLMVLTRRLSKGDALRECRRLAGVADESPDRWRPTPAPRRLPAPPSLDAGEWRQRTRALRLAAHHYATLGGWLAGPVIASPESHLMFLRDDLGLSEIDTARTEQGLAIAGDYARSRLRALRSPVRTELAEIVGLAPSPRSGLAQNLASHGGAGLVDAAKRAGLLREDGSEPLAGRLVYVWTDPKGVALYLTGRAVPGFTREDAPKVLALPVFGAGADPGRGVPRPGVPFGLRHALELADRRPGRPIVIVEGEAQAFAGLASGRAVLATGGTSRTKAQDIRSALGGRPALVAFDVEDDAGKQTRTDERALRLAADLGASWVPASRREGRA